MSPSSNNSPTKDNLAKDNLALLMPESRAIRPSNSMIHLNNLNSVKRETTHAGDTEQVFNEVIVTEDFELAIIGDED